MTEIAKLLEREYAALLRFVEVQGSGLLRFESADDLLQGVHLRALQGGAQLEDRGPEAFRSWLFTLARRHIADRHDHWTALKRGTGRVLRWTWSATSSDPGATPPPAVQQTGPGTFASRREQLVLVAKALDALPPRDRELVRWSSEGLSNAEQAARLDMTEAAAQRATHRALERFKKTFRLVVQRAGT